MEPSEKHRGDWAIDAEEDLEPTIPLAFFPWWASLPACLWLAFGAHTVTPPSLSLATAISLGVFVFAWGVVLRRGPKPTLLRSWLATIAAIAVFLVGLLAYLNDDDLLRMVWSSTAWAFLAYLAVMSLRSDALVGLRRAPR